MALASSIAEHGVGIGDLIFTTLPRIEHVGLIVGWGKPVTSWDELRDLSQPVLILSEHRTDTYSIPYIVDNGQHGRFVSQYPNSNGVRDFTASVLSGPKPFYALSWPPQDGSTMFTTLYRTQGGKPIDQWGYIKVPMTVSFPREVVQDYEYVEFTEDDAATACPTID